MRTLLYFSCSLHFCDNAKNEKHDIMFSCEFPQIFSTPTCSDQTSKHVITGATVLEVIPRLLLMTLNRYLLFEYNRFLTYCIANVMIIDDSISVGHYVGFKMFTLGNRDNNNWSVQFATSK